MSKVKNEIFLGMNFGIIPVIIIMQMNFNIVLTEWTFHLCYITLIVLVTVMSKKRRPKTLLATLLVFAVSLLTYYLSFQVIFYFILTDMDPMGVGVFLIIFTMYGLPYTIVAILLNYMIEKRTANV